MPKIKIGISSCLLGEKVRFDGQHKWDRYVTGTLGQFFDWVPVCPEVEYGLPTPRETLRLVGDPRNPRLMTGKTKIDHTEGMLSWSSGRLDSLENEDLSGFIFKNRSPSSGMGGVKVYSEDGMPSGRGSGIFAAAFMKRFPLIPVIDDGRLHDMKLRETFLEKVFVYRNWQEFKSGSRTTGDLVNFHTRHKMLLLSHHPQIYREMGKLVARSSQLDGEQLHQQYAELLMRACSLPTTPKKNANVLQHILGYFKKQLSAEEKQEMLNIIENYRNGLIPLIAPIVMVNHYVGKYDVEYLRNQLYLNPHPLELQLRNHA